MTALFLKWSGRNIAPCHQEPSVWRDDVDVVRLEREAAIDLHDRHRSAKLENASKFAFMIWIEVNDDDEGGT